MANPEHLKILKQGGKAWNAWRKNQPGVKLNLRGLNLSGSDTDFGGADLSNADLSLANLSYMTLPGANLRHSQLHGTILATSNLSDADLSGASCIGTNFAGSLLSNANFSRAFLEYCDFSGQWVLEEKGQIVVGLLGATTHLPGAVFNKTQIKDTTFSGADLAGADFKEAVLYRCVFTSATLKDAKNLATCIHRGPSLIDFITLQESWPLPLPFLRGCGLPDTYIEYIPSLVNSAIEFYSCFISYSSRNQIFADRLYSDLQNKGVRCWLASEDLKIGERIRVGIDESIRIHDKLLLVLSKHSVASDWVEQEVETALERERREKRTVLFPIRLDDAVMNVKSGWPALIRNTRNIGDFRKWKNHDAYQRAFARLLRDLQAAETKP